MAWGGTDPLRYEFGSKSGVFVFTDRGVDGIERVAFQGDVQDPGAYDLVGEETRFISQQDYELMDYWIENPDSDVGAWFCTREADHDEEQMFDFPLQKGEGMHIYYCSLHERAVVTDRGLEFVRPPVSGIRSIR